MAHQPVTYQAATMRTAAHLTLVGVLGLLAVACGGGDDPAADPPGTSAPEPRSPATTGPATTVAGTTVPATTAPGTTGPDPTTEASMPDPHPPEVLTAIADLVERTGAEPEAVTVAGFESVTWRDGSIGCPQPGMSYTQALVPGYRIELVLDGTSHWYHGARDSEPFWCATPSDPLDGGSPDT